MKIRSLIYSSTFIQAHKRQATDFTRVRVFTFQMILTIILRKSVKSIQLNLNELVTQLPQSIMSVTNSAYTQARAKLKHTAFIALNQVIMESVYTDDTYRKYLDRRVLAVDG